MAKLTERTRGPPSPAQPSDIPDSNPAQPPNDLSAVTNEAELLALRQTPPLDGSGRGEGEGVMAASGEVMGSERPMSDERPMSGERLMSGERPMSDERLSLSRDTVPNLSSATLAPLATEQMQSLNIAGLETFLQSIKAGLK